MKFKKNWNKKKVLRRKFIKKYKKKSLKNIKERVITSEK